MERRLIEEAQTQAVGGPLAEIINEVQQLSEIQEEADPETQELDDSLDTT